MYNGKRTYNLPRGQGNHVALPTASSGLMFLCGVLLLLLSAEFFFCFWQESQAYEQAATIYTTLADSVSIAPAVPEKRKSRLDFEPLLEKNPDTVAWLEMPGLNLSLPVVWSGENDTYLHTAFDGSPLRSGCLFLAGSASPDFSNPYQVIYGHRLHNGTMFGSLAAYKEQEMWAEYPTFTLYTPEQDYLCTIFSCFRTLDGNSVYRPDWKRGSEFTAFLKEIKEASIYETDVEVSPNSRILTLSTCDSAYSGQLKRFVIQAVMEPMD